MAFFEKLGETMATKGKAIGDKAKTAAESGKCKLQIGSNEGKIKTLYSTIGEKLVKEFPEVAKESFSEEFGQIEQLEAEIAELRARIEELGKED